MFNCFPVNSTVQEVTRLIGNVTTCSSENPSGVFAIALAFSTAYSWSPAWSEELKSKSEMPNTRSPTSQVTSALTDWITPATLDPRTAGNFLSIRVPQSRP